MRLLVTDNGEGTFDPHIQGLRDGTRGGIKVILEVTRGDRYFRELAP